MLDAISGSKLAARSKRFFNRLDRLARKTRLIVRRSPKFSAQGLVLSLLKAVQTGKSSFNQLAGLLGMSEPRTMSRQGLWNRIDDKALGFMVRVTGEAIKDRWGDELLIASGKFSRVIVEDSSQAKTHRNNAEDFPAHGNDGGRTAGCKFDLSFDLLTGEPISEALHLATEQDRELGKDVVDRRLYLITALPVRLPRIRPRPQTPQNGQEIPQIPASNHCPMLRLTRAGTGPSHSRRARPRPGGPPAACRS